MKRASRRSPRTRRSLEPIAWGALPVLALGVGVLASGVGIDLLILAVGCLLLLTLDRTVGDWLAETLGSGLGTAAFALAVIGFTWYFISYPSDEFFAAAEERGYRTAYYHRTPAPVVASESGGGTGGASVHAAVTPSSGGTSQSGTPAVLNTAPQQKGEARSTVEDLATSPAREAARTESTEGPKSERPRRSPGAASAASTRVFGTPATVPAPAIPSRSVLTVSPAQVAPGRRTTFQVTVTVAGRPVTQGAVTFTVNGTGVGKVALDSHGVAMTNFASHIPGTYEVRARFVGTAIHESSSSGTQMLHVAQR